MTQKSVEYCAKNKEKRKETVRISNMKRRDAKRAWIYQWRKDNPEKAKQIQKKTGRKWHVSHPLKVIEHKHRRRARKLNAPGSYTAQDARNIYNFQNGRCKYCNADLEVTGKHLDHVIPLSRGGSNWPTNLQYLCPHCNCSKKNKMPWEWRPDLFLGSGSS